MLRKQIIYISDTMKVRRTVKIRTQLKRSKVRNSKNSVNPRKGPAIKNDTGPLLSPFSKGIIFF